ncbi:MAG TPA: DNA topoisomerase IB [Actinomycetes bacterium]|nr:DNA topoisomerase IB [Actinomycetes bacterium]
MRGVRRVDCSTPGIRRLRRGRGFTYIDERTGEGVRDPETLERIRSLVIPPAWRQVWICPIPDGHLQAVGTDDAGRRQYLYHQIWRERRDQAKFDHVLEFARALPALRERVVERLGDEGLSRDRVLACAVRLLDRGFFRIGSESYAEQNDTYGLATMGRRHVRVQGDTVVFDYASKGGKRVVASVVDPEVREVVAALRRRRGGGPGLLAWRDGRCWVDARSEDINDYLKEQTGSDFTAKDFRTWNATVLAAVALSASWPVARSRTARDRAISRAVKEVARYLGNTPAVCRGSYIDPRLFDRYRSGLTIEGALDRVGDVEVLGEPAHHAIEEAVLELISERRAEHLDLGAGRPA